VVQPLSEEGAVKTKTKAALIVALVVGMPVVWYATYRWMQGPLPERGNIHTPQDTKSGPTGVM
jgi:hypothetical protein